MVLVQFKVSIKKSSGCFECGLLIEEKVGPTGLLVTAVFDPVLFVEVKARDRVVEVNSVNTCRLKRFSEFTDVIRGIPKNGDIHFTFERGTHLYYEELRKRIHTLGVGGRGGQAGLGRAVNLRASRSKIGRQFVKKKIRRNFNAALSRSQNPRFNKNKTTLYGVSAYVLDRFSTVFVRIIIYPLMEGSVLQMCSNKRVRFHCE